MHTHVPECIHMFTNSIHRYIHKHKDISYVFLLFFAAYIHTCTGIVQTCNRALMEHFPNAVQAVLYPVQRRRYYREPDGTYPQFQ